MNELGNELKVRVIGAGGIGGALLPVLCRVLNYGTAAFEFADVEIGVVDGDKFEISNAQRQAFPELGNKADVTVAELEEDFNNLFIRSMPFYVNQDNIGRIIEEGQVVFACVDNHATRKLISDHCETLKNVTVISGGNDYSDGNIQVFIRRDGKNVTLPLANKYHPEIQEPNDENPSDLADREGCLELAPSDPQLLIANFAIASLMLNAFHALVINKLDYDEVYKDIITNNASAKKRST